MKITAMSDSPSIVTVDPEAVLDENGQAVLNMSALLPGKATISLTLEGTSLTAQVQVNAAMPEPQIIPCEKPVASIPTPSTVSTGTKVSITSATQNSSIYYTTDGTCPCIDDGSRQLYTGPIELKTSVTILAVAYKDGMDYSSTAQLVYTVTSTIIFDTAGGNLIDSLTGEVGTLITPPETPTRAGYIFLGWSQGLPVSFPDEETTVIALWNKLGDVNGDNEITALDALMALQKSSKEIALTELQVQFADVNKDGCVSPLDALMILQYASGLILNFTNGI